jgi:hypothetical protein
VVGDQAAWVEAGGNQTYSEHDPVDHRDHDLLELRSAIFLSCERVSCEDEQKNKHDHIILPKGNRIDFVYDTQDNLNMIKDSLNNTINYTYNSDGKAVAGRR